MSWTAADIPDQTGRTAVVTGANGRRARDGPLAGAGAHVVMAADATQEKAAAAVAEIHRSTPGASLELIELDLGSLASVRQAAEQALASHAQIDILINNAAGGGHARGRDGQRLRDPVRHQPSGPLGADGAADAGAAPGTPRHAS